MLKNLMICDLNVEIILAIGENMSNVFSFGRCVLALAV